MSALEVGYQLTQIGVQGGLSRAGKGDEVERGLAVEEVIELGQHVGRGDVAGDPGSEVGSGAAFAVDAIEGTGLIGQKVHAQGTTEPAGRDRAEEVAATESTGRVSHGGYGESFPYLMES